MKTVEVKFDTYGKTYHYLFPYDVMVEKGDKCVVLVENEYKVVKVEAVLEDASIKATRPVVCKVEELPYLNFLEKDRKIRNIKTLLDKKMKEFSEIAMYEALTKHDPVAAELVKQLKELN